MILLVGLVLSDSGLACARVADCCLNLSLTLPPYHRRLLLRTFLNHRFFPRRSRTRVLRANSRRDLTSTAHVMAPYEYAPIDKAAGDIRLMTLLPGPFDAEICVSIEIVVLANDHVPKFEVLSYAWSSPVNRIEIHIQSKDLNDQSEPSSQRSGWLRSEHRTLLVT